LSFEEASKKLDKRYWTSSYEETFGRSQGIIDFGNADILTYKKVSELECSVILTENAKRAIDHWIALGEQLHYIKMGMQALWNLYTAIRTRGPIESTSHAKFKKY